MGYFVTYEMGLDKIYPYTKFKVYSFNSFTRSKDTAHVPLNGWMRKGVCPNLRRFLPDPHQIWHHN